MSHQTASVDDYKTFNDIDIEYIVSVNGLKTSDSTKINRKFVDALENVERRKKEIEYFKSQRQIHENAKFASTYAVTEATRTLQKTIIEQSSIQDLIYVTDEKIKQQTEIWNNDINKLSMQVDKFNPIYGAIGIELSFPPQLWEPFCIQPSSELLLSSQHLLNNNRDVINYQQHQPDPMILTSNGGGGEYSNLGSELYQQPPQPTSFQHNRHNRVEEPQPPVENVYMDYMDIELELLCDY